MQALNGLHFFLPHIIPPVLPVAIDIKARRAFDDASFIGVKHNQKGKPRRG